MGNCTLDCDYYDCSFLGGSGGYSPPGAGPCPYGCSGTGGNSGTGNGGSSGSDPNSPPPSLSPEEAAVFQTMNPMEKARCKAHPFECSTYIQQSLAAINFSETYSNGNDNKRNALRHTMWNARMTIYYGSALTANLWAEAHEQGSVGSDPGDTCRDRRNNAIGQQIGGSFLPRRGELSTGSTLLMINVRDDILEKLALGLLQLAATCSP